MEKKSLTKLEIIDRVYNAVDRNRSEVKKYVENLIEQIKAELAKGENVLISGFGKFESYRKKPRKGRNPQTAQKIILPERQVVVFRTSKKLKEKINQQ